MNLDLERHLIRISRKILIFEYVECNKNISLFLLEDFYSLQGLQMFNWAYNFIAATHVLMSAILQYYLQEWSSLIIEKLWVLKFLFFLLIKTSFLQTKATNTLDTRIGWTSQKSIIVDTIEIRVLERKWTKVKRRLYSIHNNVLITTKPSNTFE